MSNGKQQTADLSDTQQNGVPAKTKENQRNRPKNYLWGDAQQGQRRRGPWFLAHALEQILSPIIRSHPEVSFKLPAKKKGEEYRLQQSMKYLIGYKVKTGKPAEVDREQLTLLADSYWKVHDSPDLEDVSLWSLVAEVVIPRWRENGYTYDQVDPYTTSLTNAFLDDKDWLLTRAAVQNLEDFEERQAKIEKVLVLLEEIGVIDLRKLTPP